jgi:2-methylcitrate dehydratase PrpD
VELDSSANQSSVTDDLAEFAAGLTPADVPVSVQRFVKRHLLDQIGIELACSTLPWVKVAQGYASQFGKSGTSTVMGRQERLDAEPAAFVNAIAGHGFEMDDYFPGAYSHPGSVVVPTALSVGEELESTGAEVLAALVVGFETLVRIGAAVTPSLLQHRGFHAPSAVGVFGSAVVTGRLLHFNQTQMVTALGIAGSHSSGTTEYTQSGGDVKRLHAGLGALGGLRSARLANAGFTAPRAILEGRRGFLQAFAQSYDAESIARDLGTVWESAERAALKPYCCCGAIHPQITAALRALAESGHTTDEIVDIRIGVDATAVSHVGSIGPEPKDATEAQFSAHFAVALALVKQDAGFATFVGAVNDGFKDEAVLTLSRKIRVEFDSEFEEKSAGSRKGKVDITFEDGSVNAVSCVAKGSPEDPLLDDEVHAKFMSLATQVISDEQARQIIQNVENLENLASVQALLEPLHA